MARAAKAFLKHSAKQKKTGTQSSFQKTHCVYLSSFSSWKLRQHSAKKTTLKNIKWLQSFVSKDCSHLRFLRKLRPISVWDSSLFLPFRFYFACSKITSIAFSSWVSVCPSVSSCGLMRPSGSSTTTSGVSPTPWIQTSSGV